MPAAVSLYIYRIRVFQINGRVPISFEDAQISTAIPDFIRKFVGAYAKLKEDHERQRTWFFDPPKHDADGEISGYLRYGTFGFESSLYDTKTKAKRYDRKTTDFEQIELYYQFWCPEDQDFALTAFQSFSGRSCISYVIHAIQEEFKAKNKGLSLRIDKIAPQLVHKKTFANSDIRQISFIKRSASTDLADLHGASRAPKEVEVEVRVTAKSGSFGKFGKLDSMALRSNPGVYAVGTAPFQKAVATVEFNGKPRRVGVFGDAGNAGAFDVTEDLTFGSNGHPDYKSIDKIADGLLADAHSALT